MSCKRTVYDFDHPGMVKEIVVPEHSYAWSGRMPNTGTYRCIYCGKPEDSTTFSGRRKTMRKSEPEKCPHCKKRAIEHLEGDTWECYDCGETFKHPGRKTMRKYTIQDVENESQKHYKIGLDSDDHDRVQRYLDLGWTPNDIVRHFEWKYDLTRFDSTKPWGMDLDSKSWEGSSRRKTMRKKNQMTSGFGGDYSGDFGGGFGSGSGGGFGGSAPASFPSTARRKAKRQGDFYALKGWKKWINVNTVALAVLIGVTVVVLNRSGSEDAVAGYDPFYKANDFILR